MNQQPYGQKVEISYYPVQPYTGQEHPTEELHRIIYRNEYGSYDRKDGPAIREWLPDGTKIREEFWESGRLTRAKGPAQTTWYKNGRKCTEIYKLNGVTHREGSPASFSWHQNGQLREEVFYQNGLIHSESGPAGRLWDEFGKKEYESFYLANKLLSREHWLEQKKTKRKTTSPTTMSVTTTIQQTVTINGQQLSITDALELLLAAQKSEEIR